MVALSNTLSLNLRSSSLSLLEPLSRPGRCVITGVYQIVVPQFASRWKRRTRMLQGVSVCVAMLPMSASNAEGLTSGPQECFPARASSSPPILLSHHLTFVTSPLSLTHPLQHKRNKAVPLHHTSPRCFAFDSVRKSPWHLAAPHHLFQVNTELRLSTIVALITLTTLHLFITTLDSATLSEHPAVRREA